MSLTAGSMQRELGGSGSATAAHSTRANSTKIRYALVRRISSGPGRGMRAWDLRRGPDPVPWCDAAGSFLAVPAGCTFAGQR